MKRVIAFLLAMSVILCACSESTRQQTSDITESGDKRLIVSEVVNKNGRTYVEYKGRPYLMYGIQMRFDNLRSENIYDLNVYEEYFKYAKEAGFKSVLIPVLWIETEVAEDSYDFFYLGKYIEWCNKYDLDLQIIWFGADVCGYSTLPGYIWEDREKYPRNPYYEEFSEFSYDLSDPDLRERAKKVIEAMMDYIYENDKNQVVSMIQLENESDNAEGLYETNWNDHDDVTKKGFCGSQSQAVLELIELEGQTVKNSNYRVVTRHNFTPAIKWNAGYEGILKKAGALMGLDIIGIDAYARSIVEQNDLMDFLRRETFENKNVPHIPENGAHWDGTICLTLSSFERGEGNMLYQLRSAANQPDDTGLYRQSSDQWIERDGTQTVQDNPVSGSAVKEININTMKAFNKMIYKADELIASMPEDQITAFNTENIKSNYRSAGLACGPYTLIYDSPSGSQALAVTDMDDNLILMSLFDGTFTVSDKNLSGKASLGYFDDNGKWIEEKEIQLNGNSVKLASTDCLIIEKENIK